MKPLTMLIGTEKTDIESLRNKVQKVLLWHGRYELAHQFVNRINSVTSYKEALKISKEYVEIY